MFFIQLVNRGRKSCDQKKSFVRADFPQGFLFGTASSAYQVSSTQLYVKRMQYLETVEWVRLLSTGPQQSTQSPCFYFYFDISMKEQ